MERAISLSLVTLSLILSAPRAFAWGERGHDMITRLAAREVMRTEPTLGRTLVAREHMLAHLANVPDIVWRNGDQATRDANSPTHYYDADWIDPTAKNLPLDLAKTVEVVRQRCKDGPDCPVSQGADAAQILEKIGTAPWRISQLHGKMTAALMEFAHLQKRGASREKLGAAWDQALLWAGLLSHFVGDLSQPLHTTRNYDGWDNGHGGIHAWFETDLVNHLSLDADRDIAERVVVHRSQTRSRASRDALNIAMDLTRESWSQLDLLWALDRRAILKSGQISKEGVKVPATRMVPEQAAPEYQNFAKDRMGVGANVLATLWIHAWKSAGSPDMDSTSTWTYPVAPPFVPFDGAEFGAKEFQGTLLMIGAAASMRNVLEALATHPFQNRIDVKMTFGASSTIAAQIKSGAPIDVILSADRLTLDKLGAAVDPDSRTIVARGHLVLAARRGWWTSKTNFDFDCITRKNCPIQKIATAHPAVPVGGYAREAMQSLNREVAAKLIAFEHVRAGLAALGSGAVDAAFAYKTDLEDAGKGQFEILIDLTPRLKNPVVWEAAVVASSQNKTAAKLWIQRLSGEEGRKILTSKGFAPP